MSAPADPVSVIVPAGKVDAALDTQLQAIAAQQCAFAFEIVVALNVDDSVDTDSMQQRSASLGDNVRVVVARGKRGAAFARNVGVAAAKNDRLAFCDADDRVHPGWLAALIDGLAQHDAVSGAVIDVFPDERTASWHPPATPGGLPSFLGHPYLLSGNLAVSRAAFEDVGGFDENLIRCEDIAFSWALTRRGYSLGFVTDAMLDYNHRAGLRLMLRQHYFYGRGMSEVLDRFGVPGASESSLEESKWLSALNRFRPNGQAVAHRNLGSTARRAAIAAGRARGLVGRRTPTVEP